MDEKVKRARDVIAEYVHTASRIGKEGGGTSRESLIQTGALIWELLLQGGPKLSENQKLLKLQQLVSTNNHGWSAHQRMMLSGVLMMPDQQVASLAAGSWYDQGLPAVQMGHKYAAALMATNPGKNNLSDVKPPWAAFLINLPNNLLTVYDPAAGRRVNATFILVHHALFEGKGMRWSYITFTETGITMWRHAATAKELVCIGLGANDYEDYAFLAEGDDEDDRVAKVIGRLILGVCMATSGKGRNLKAVGSGHKAHAGASRQNRPPVQRVFQLGKPIKLDCRQALKDYIEGTVRSPLSVQCLVMGHWKRQVHGPQRSLRKWLWIEPYWRGPEDAPILHRPHDLGDG